MNRGEILHELRRRGEFDSADDAENALVATLSVLGERLAGGETRDLGAQLPSDLADALGSRGSGERFDLTEFYRRVAEREERDVNPAIARDHARVVLDVVLSAVSAGEREDVVHQLPEEYRRDLID